MVAMSVQNSILANDYVWTGVEDEEHFITAYDRELERALFFNKILQRNLSYSNLTNKETVILITCADSQILTGFENLYTSLSWIEICSDMTSENANSFCECTDMIWY